MSTSSHWLQNVHIAESAMTAFFMAFIVSLLLALGLFEAGLSIPVTLGGLEIGSTTMAAALSAAVSLFFALLAVLLVTVLA